MNQGLGFSYANRVYGNRNRALHLKHIMYSKGLIGIKKPQGATPPPFVSADQMTYELACCLI